MKNRTYKVLTPSGYQSFDGIRKLTKPVIKFVTDKNSISVTEDHPFFIRGKEIKANTLKVGDFLESKDGFEMIWDIIPDGETDVYDLLNVDNGSIYYANNILVHNCFHPPGKAVIDPILLEELKKKCNEPILVTDDGSYRIYANPNPDSFYAVGVDVSEGIGRSNSVVQILDVSNLKKIEQVATYANRNISPYVLGTRLMGILNDWGRPPVLVESNSYGLQVLEVLHNTHRYENIVTYKYEGMSKHYNNDNRFGIYSHTNTKYRGLTNFRYWIDTLKAVKFNDLETLIELSNFIQLPNYTFGTKKGDDHDDRIFAMVWALFILEPTLTKNYFNILETDDQGRPVAILPFSDNRELIKASPIFTGTVNVHTVDPNNNNVYPMAYVPTGIQKDPGLEAEQAQLTQWLHRWQPKGEVHSPYLQQKPQIYGNSRYFPNQDKNNEPPNNETRPLVFF